MKMVRSQNRAFAVNVMRITSIQIMDFMLENGYVSSGTGDIAIGVYTDVSASSSSTFWTIAMYHTEEEAARNLDKLVDFIGSGISYGVFEMP